MDQQVATDMRASKQRIAAASDQARAMRVVFRFRNVESLQSVHLLNLFIEKSSSNNNNDNDNTEYHRPITECNWEPSKLAVGTSLSNVERKSNDKWHKC